MPDIVYRDAIDGDVPAYLAVPDGAGRVLRWLTAIHRVTGVLIGTSWPSTS